MKKSNEISDYVMPELPSLPLDEEASDEVLQLINSIKDKASKI